MMGSIENREAFLSSIAKKMNREPESHVAKPEWTYRPQESVYQGYSQEQLLEVMKKACESIHTKVFETDSEHLSSVLDDVISKYGGGSIVSTRDHRFTEFGLDNWLKEHHVYVWDVSKGHENIDKADQAKIGLSICDVMLAESATAGLFNDKDKARSVSLLPVTSIVLVQKSLIVPRITQAMQMVENQLASGEDLSTYINFISGPSNSADIEMRLVVGVHGPVKVAYIVIGDR